MIRSRNTFQESIHRMTAAACALILLASSIPTSPANAQQVTAPAKSNFIRKGSKNITIFEPTIELSEDPSDADLVTARIFSERLAAKQNTLSMPGENRAVRQALVAHKAKGDPEDLSDLKLFIQSYPNSRWRPALEFNMARLSFESGYWSEALSLYKSAFEALRDETGLEQQLLANGALANYLLLSARLGRKEEVTKYLEIAKTRKNTESVAGIIDGAKQGLATMTVRPECAYKCGPYALNRILRFLGKTSGLSQVVANASSTHRGTNLTQVKNWAKQCGLDYQIAKRAPGAPLLMPSIVHWKVSHFAALTEMTDNRYHVEDPTFGQSDNFWLSARSIDSESDGYFLVPNSPLPDGWTKVSDEEASAVWGKGAGHIPQYGALGPGIDNQCTLGPCVCWGMASASVWTMLASLHIVDIPVGYTPPIGPDMQFEISYNHLDAYQPVSPAFSTFGPDWSFGWVSYLTVDASRNVILRLRGGGSEVFNFVQPNNVTNPYAPSITSQAILQQTGANKFQRSLPDGSIEVFDQSDGTGRIFMTKLIDPQGNASTITYNANFRISAITDAISQQTIFTYLSNSAGNANYYKISGIEDPFGRSATFAWDDSNIHITSIIDTIGLQSSFVYESNSSFITQMTTPYGITNFERYTPSPLVPPTGGFPAEARGLRFSFPDGTTAVMENWAGPPTRSFFWDRHAMELYPGDPGAGNYEHCKTTRFLVSPDGVYETPVASWMKMPLESTVNFKYQGEGAYSIGETFKTVGVSNQPIEVRRMLDNGEEQVSTFEYNNFGMMTRSEDALQKASPPVQGRTFSYSYAGNNIDLLEIREVRGSDNFLMGKWSYNDKHLPLVYIDGSGQRTQYSYNSAGQVLSVIDSNHKITSFTYNGNFYLTEIDGPLSGTLDKTTIHYDNVGRIDSVTDSRGYVLLYEYDNADRLSKISYPDGTTEEFKFDRLDQVASKDRNGRWSISQFDSVRQLAREVDPLGRATRYSWCSCGSLVSLQDGAGNTTNWHHDLQGRTVKKLFANGTATNYEFENSTSRLKSRTDALGQITSYSYNNDDTLANIVYDNEVSSTPTPNVSLSWSPNFRRMTTIDNSSGGSGWGALSYSYNDYLLDSSLYKTGKLTVTGSPGGGSLTINLRNSSFGGGVQAITASASGTTSQVASNIATAVNGNSPASALGIIASASGSEVTLSAPIQAGVMSANRQLLVQETLGGTATTGNVINVIVNDEALPGGTRTVSYTVKSTDTTLTLIATGLAAAINNDNFCDNARIKASSASAVVTITSDSVNHTTYSQNTSGGATVTISQGTVRPEFVKWTTTTGGGHLSQVSNNVIANSAVNYVYDSLGRTLKRVIHDEASNKTEYTFDAMSRVLGESNALGTFTYSYIDNTVGASRGTSQLSAISYPNSQVTNFHYFGNLGDQRLQEICNQSSGGLLSQFTYNYNPSGEITRWQQTQNNNRRDFDLDYDDAGQLISAHAGSALPTVPYSQEYEYHYDAAANRTSEQRALTETLRVGGAKTTGDVLTITVKNVGLTGGQKSINYTVQTSDTLTSIASALSAAITLDASLGAIGVSSSSFLDSISLKSISPNETTYTISTSGGATETLKFGCRGDGSVNASIGGTKTTNDVLTLRIKDPGLPSGQVDVSYTVLSGDTLSSIATAMKNAVNANSNLQSLGITATNIATIINIRSKSPNFTRFEQLTSNGSGGAATETITLSTNVNPSQSIAISGTKTTNDELTILIFDSSLPSGRVVIPYTVLSGDSLSSIATNITSAINANSNLNTANIKATSSGATIAIRSLSSNLTSYSYLSNTGATEILTLSTNPNPIQTIAVAGTKTTSDVLSLTIYDPSILSDGVETVSYTVLSGDTLSSIATGIKNAINANSSLQSAGFSAVSSGTRLSVESTSQQPSIFRITTSAAATETLSIAPKQVRVQSGAVIGNGTTNPSSIFLSIFDSGLPTGGLQLSESVSIGSTPATMAAGLASQINGNSNLQTIGVTAEASGIVLNVFSTSTDMTSYLSANYPSAGGLERLFLATNYGIMKSTFDKVNELRALSPGGKGRFRGSTTKPITARGELVPPPISYSNILSQTIDISQTASGTTTYSASVDSATTVPGEALQLGVNNQGSTTVSVLRANGLDSSPNSNDNLNITIHDARLASGQKTITYDIQPNDTFARAAAGLASAISSDSDMVTIGIKANVVTPIVDLDWSQQFEGAAELCSGLGRPEITVSGYSTDYKTTKPAYSTIGTNYVVTTPPAIIAIAGSNFEGNTPIKIVSSGSGGQIDISTFSPLNENGPIVVSYSASSGESTTSVATALKNLINGNTSLQALGVSATSSADIIIMKATSGQQNMTFDANGNMTSDGVNTYEWDVENRLTKITYPGTGNDSKFVLDPLGRNTKIIETVDSAANTKLFVWNKDQRCEERDNVGNVARRFFRNGETVGANLRFYTFDHLGSIREMTDQTGTVKTQYASDPSGRTLRIAGNENSSFRFAGYFCHERSGLSLTRHRAYSSTFCRWLSRDPLEELQGTNLYAYVQNDPVNSIDPSGLGTNTITKSPPKCCPRPQIPQAPTVPSPRPLPGRGRGLILMLVIAASISAAFALTEPPASIIVPPGLSPEDCEAACAENLAQAIPLIERSIGRRLSSIEKLEMLLDCIERCGCPRGGGNPVLELFPPPRRAAA